MGIIFFATQYFENILNVFAEYHPQVVNMYAALGSGKVFMLSMNLRILVDG